MTYKLNPLTVDVIIEENESILMIRRESDTFNDYLALPGGFVDYGELVEKAAIREAKEEIGVDIIPQSILGIYSGDKRDPRGPTVSVAFICKYEGEIIAGDDASSYEWLKLKDLEKFDLAFDHKDIINDYIAWKLNKDTYWTSK